MFSFFYDLLLGLYLILRLPGLLFSKKKANLFKKLVLPDFSLPAGRKKVWVHAVSLGEAKAAALLVAQLKRQGFLVIFSVSTQTGFEQAQKTPADQSLFLPFDFSFLMKRLTKKLQPELVVLIETDFWYHFLKYMRLSGAKIALLSGKLSNRSFRRLKYCVFFAKKLFGLFDLLAVQNATYQKRFRRFASRNKVQISGNLKLQGFSCPVSSEDSLLKKRLKLSPQDQIITIASTHFPEEKRLLNELGPLLKKNPNLKLFLAPRHPERFRQVEKLLKKLPWPYAKLSRLAPGQILLIDQMGFLNQAFSLSSLAIVGGSFTSKIGGHNILEPLAFGVPVIFGPYMYKQEDLKKLVLQKKLGYQLKLEEIKTALLGLLPQTNQEKARFQNDCQKLFSELKAEEEKSFNLIRNLL
ncbi:MAG: glycosyltransferase N-terminal domain-containing protein [Parachlamydiales bacterium]|jgi:3-deoxy-D-manno-octulosonic-acid transferase